MIATRPLRRNGLALTTLGFGCAPLGDLFSRIPDLQAIGTTDLQAIQANQTAISSAVSAIGAMSNRATAAASRLDDLEDGTKQKIDDLTGIDYAKAISEYTTQSAAYEASLKVGAQISQPSLLQFLS